MKVRGALALSASLILPGAEARAQTSTELVEGVITHIELVGSPRTISVKTEGQEIVAEIAARTLVVFEGSAASVNAAAELSSLRPGMTVRLARDPRGVVRIHVIAVPGDLRVESKDGEHPPRAARTVKARLRDLRYDARLRRGEVKVDVAGRRETFASRDASLFRGFRRGDLVLLGLAADGSVVSMQSARLVGRATRVDARRREITVEIDGKLEEFTVANELLDRVRAGDVIHFDAEERSGGRRVITAVY